MGVEKLEKPAEPRGCKGEGGILSVKESLAPDSPGQEGARPHQAGSGQASGAVRGRAHVCGCGVCTCMHTCTLGGPLDFSLQASEAICVC